MRDRLSRLLAPPHKKQEKIMSILPQGEDVRRAIKWISEMRQSDPQADSGKLVEQACLNFNLSPVEADFLARWLEEN
jgi:hypothetical protein